MGLCFSRKLKGSFFVHLLRGAGRYKKRKSFRKKRSESSVQVPDCLMICSRGQGALHAIGNLYETGKAKTLIPSFVYSLEGLRGEKGHHSGGYPMVSLSRQQMSLWSFILLLVHITGVTAISCYGDNDKAVDWFIVYKLPHQLRSKDPDSGMKYMYQDAESGGWLPGRSLMNNTASAVGRTLSQLYGSTKAKDVAYVLYNDQAPADNANAIRGHTKGVVLLDKAQGFWLVHSTPHFPPPVDQKYGWPHSAVHNGQSFLCVTYPYSQFKDIGTQLLYNTITSYDSSVPDDFSQDLPDLKAASQKKNVNKPPWNRQVTLTSVGGKEFTSFSKNLMFGDDLYSGWVSQALKSDLYVQFWLNSRRKLMSNCSLTYHTYNIKAINFSSTITFSSHVDHSKWCVTGPEVPGWTCIGDMNRNLEEEHRGGGTVCVMDPVIWKSFHMLISEYFECNLMMS